MKQFILVALAVALFNPAPAAARETTPTGDLKIVERLLPNDCWSTRTADAVVDMIMLHFCSDVIQNPDKPFQLDRIYQIFSSVKVSAHYLIDRDGTVYRMVPEKDKAWHAGRGTFAHAPDRKDALNNLSVGIEMFAIGSQSDMALFGIKEQQYNDLKTSHPENIGFTDAQYASLKTLMDGIIERNPAIKRDRFHIVGHSEYAGKARRTDPGELFDWSRIGLPKEIPSTSSTLRVTTTTVSADSRSTRPVWNFFRHYDNRLKEIGEAVAKLPPDSKDVVVMLGDSITEAFKMDQVLSRTVVNMGISGDQVDMPTTNTGGVLRRVGLVAKARPTDIFLLIGINDMGSQKPLNDLETQYRALVKALREQIPGARLHIQSILPCSGRFAFHNPNVGDMNRRIMKIAEENGVEYIDIGSMMKDEKGELRADYTYDGLHLLGPAYEKWKARVEEALAAEKK